MNFRFIVIYYLFSASIKLPLICNLEFIKTYLEKLLFIKIYIYNNIRVL